MTSHGLLNYSSRLWSQILLLPWWNNLNPNHAIRYERQGTPVLLEMKLHYVMGKLVTWGRRLETLFSPRSILTGHGQDLIQRPNTYFASNIFYISYLLAADLGPGRSDIQALRVPYWQNFGMALLGRRAYLGENNYFHSSFAVTARLFHFQDISHCAV